MLLNSYKSDSGKPISQNGRLTACQSSEHQALAAQFDSEEQHLVKFNLLVILLSTYWMDFRGQKLSETLFIVIIILFAVSDDGSSLYFGENFRYIFFKYVGRRLDIGIFRGGILYCLSSVGCWCGVGYHCEFCFLCNLCGICMICNLYECVLLSFRFLFLIGQCTGKTRFIG